MAIYTKEHTLKLLEKSDMSNINEMGAYGILLTGLASAAISSIIVRKMRKDTANKANLALKRYLKLNEDCIPFESFKRYPCTVDSLRGKVPDSILDEAIFDGRSHFVIFTKDTYTMGYSFDPHNKQKEQQKMTVMFNKDIPNKHKEYYSICFMGDFGLYKPEITTWANKINKEYESKFGKNE